MITFLIFLGSLSSFDGDVPVAYIRSSSIRTCYEYQNDCETKPFSAQVSMNSEKIIVLSDEGEVVYPIVEAVETNNVIIFKVVYVDGETVFAQLFDNQLVLSRSLTSVPFLTFY